MPSERVGGTYVISGGQGKVWPADLAACVFEALERLLPEEI